MPGGAVNLVSTRDKYHKGAVKALCYVMPNDKLTKHDGPLVERILASRSQDERKVLTHDDLDPSNIMLKDN
jgi:aminoglycoside phosphotransferase (APT) family kinase protein